MRGSPRAAAVLGVCAAALAIAPSAGGSDAPGARTTARLASCGPGQDVTLAAPSGGNVYHSGYFSPTPIEVTVTDRSIDDFNALAQKDVAAVVFSDPWGRNGHTRIRFPGGKVRTIWAHGAIPVVRMMPWTKLWVTRNQPVTMQKVIDGCYDGQLLRWFRRPTPLAGSVDRRRLRPRDVWLARLHLSVRSRLLLEREVAERERFGLRPAGELLFGCARRVPSRRRRRALRLHAGVPLRLKPLEQRQASSV
jgi:hypothetical protein